MNQQVRSAPLRPLGPSETSTEKQSPRGTWMFRGIESNTKISKIGLFHLERSLQPVSTLLLPISIANLAFVTVSSHLYFSTPDSPNTLISQYIPRPGDRSDRFVAIKKRHEAPEDVKDSNGRDKNVAKRLSTLTFSDSIVRIVPERNSLLVFTVSRGRRREDDLWNLYRIHVDSEKGFAFKRPPNPSRLILPENTSTTPANLSLCAMNDLHSSCIRLYCSLGQGASPLYSATITGSADIDLKPDPVGQELAKMGCTSHLEVVSLQDDPLAQTESTQLSFAVMDKVNYRLYKIIASDTKSQIRRISRPSLLRQIGRPTRLAVWGLNTSDLGIPLEPQSQTRSFYIVASAETGRLWTIDNLGMNDVLPLVGGGNQDLFKPASKNFLLGNIGSVDELCVAHNSCLIFGTRGLPNWYALMTPPMTWALGLAEKYTNIIDRKLDPKTQKVIDNETKRHGLRHLDLDS